MQTFLPYPNFLLSAQVLDKKRCWKQVVEAKQIIDTLEKIHLYPHKVISWENHPAVRMWEGCMGSLMDYFNVFLSVSKEKWQINTKYTPFDLKYVSGGGMIQPWWVGDENFHRSMRARLIQKDRDFYLPLFPEDEGFNDGLYLWPVMDGSKTFRIV